MTKQKSGHDFRPFFDSFRLRDDDLIVGEIMCFPKTFPMWTLKRWDIWVFEPSFQCWTCIDCGERAKTPLLMLNDSLVFSVSLPTDLFLLLLSIFFPHGISVCALCWCSQWDTQLLVSTDEKKSYLSLFAAFHSPLTCSLSRSGLKTAQKNTFPTWFEIMCASFPWDAARAPSYGGRMEITQSFSLTFPSRHFHSPRTRAHLTAGWRGDEAAKGAEAVHCWCSWTSRLRGWAAMTQPYQRPGLGSSRLLALTCNQTIRPEYISPAPSRWAATSSDLWPVVLGSVQDVWASACLLPWCIWENIVPAAFASVWILQKSATCLDHFIKGSASIIWNLLCINTLIVSI